MIGKLIIHIADEDEPFTCEFCKYIFGQGYTAHWCPYPQAKGRPASVVAPTFDQRRWVRKYRP